jgi:hypothetical protein
MRRKVLLVCGVLAALVYVATDMLAAIRWEGYCYTAQTISETFAIGAPTDHSSFCVALGILSL